jgi:hypothetical protein
VSVHLGWAEEKSIKIGASNDLHHYFVVEFCCRVAGKKQKIRILGIFFRVPAVDTYHGHHTRPGIGQKKTETA